MQHEITSFNPFVNHLILPLSKVIIDNYINKNETHSIKITQIQLIMVTAQ